MLIHTSHLTNKVDYLAFKVNEYITKLTENLVDDEHFKIVDEFNEKLSILLISLGLLDVLKSMTLRTPSNSPIQSTVPANCSLSEYNLLSRACILSILSTTGRKSFHISMSNMSA